MSATSEELSRPLTSIEMHEINLSRYKALEVEIDKLKAELANMKTYSHETVRGLVDHRDETIKKLTAENAKLNIILFHKENGLSHPDFKPELEIARLIDENEKLKEKLNKCYVEIQRMIAMEGLAEILKDNNNEH
jgi:uncharacterized small protein (DUF1192 family)